MIFLFLVPHVSLVLLLSFTQALVLNKAPSKVAGVLALVCGNTIINAHARKWKLHGS